MHACMHAQVYTWGTNDYGQLGNGNTSYDIHPRRVVDLDDVTITDIATGGWCVLLCRVVDLGITDIATGGWCVLLCRVVNLVDLGITDIATDGWLYVLLCRVVDLDDVTITDIATGGWLYVLLCRVVDVDDVPSLTSPRVAGYTYCCVEWSSGRFG